LNFFIQLPDVNCSVFHIINELRNYLNALSGAISRALKYVKPEV